MDIKDKFDTEAHDAPGKRRRLRHLPLRSLAPNILTILALCAGLTAVRFGLSGKFELAVAAIMVAAVFDGLDGRVARLLDGATKFGAELDSLTDFVNFGVVPAMLLYVWTLDTLGGFGWVAALAYVVCCGLRLARFNVEMEEPDQPVWKANYFTGVPSPAAAALVLLPFYMHFAGVPYVRDAAFLIALYTGGIAFLMVSQFPTFSFKRLRVRRDLVLPTLIFVALGTAILVSYLWLALISLVALYALSIPIAGMTHARFEKRSGGGLIQP